MSLSFTQRLFDLQYGRDMMQSASSVLRAVGDQLQIPPWAEVLTAGQAAAQDSVRAIHSSSYMIFLIGRPVARLLGWILYWIGWFIYKYILVEGIYHHGLSQAKEIAILYWKWQSSLTKAQLMYEAAALLSFVALYRLYKFLERRQYHRKLVIWVDGKKRKVVDWVDLKKRLMQMTYYNGVRRIARVSLVLAAMTPHMIFWACSAAIRFFVPQGFTVFANPKFISLLSFWCPLFFTIMTLFRFREQQLQGEERARRGRESEGRSSRRLSGHDRNNNGTQETERQLTAGITSAKQSPNQLPASSSKSSLENELRDWLRFWMVRGSLEGVKNLLSWLALSWVVSIALQLELLFYLWLYCLPLIQPESIAGQKLPEGRPLRVICSILGPYSQRLVEMISAAIPAQFWQTKVVGYASQVASLLKLVHLLSEPTADWLLHMIEEGRGLVIPALSLMTPGVLTRYGVVYVQFVLPMAKSHSRQRNTDASALWLQYWVLHAGVDSILSYFSTILWWVPFSTHAIFCLWCYVSLPRTIKNWYDLFESELKLLGLLPGDHEGDFEGTNTARILKLIWELLPKAKDAHGEAESNVNKSIVAPLEAKGVKGDEIAKGMKEETTAEDTEDKLSPLPKERVVEERSPGASPSMLVSIDTCTTTTTEDGEDEYEDVDLSSNNENCDPHERFADNISDADSRDFDRDDKGKETKQRPTSQRSSPQRSSPQRPASQRSTPQRSTPRPTSQRPTPRPTSQPIMTRSARLRAELAQKRLGKVDGVRD